MVDGWMHNALISVELMALSMNSETYGCFGSLKIEILCQKSPGKSRYPQLMYKRCCLYPQGYKVHRFLCLKEGVSLPLEARKGVLA